MSVTLEQRRSRKPVLRNHGVMPVTLSHLGLCEPAELSRTTCTLQSLCFRNGLVRNRSSQNSRIAPYEIAIPKGALAAALSDSLPARTQPDVNILCHTLFVIHKYHRNPP